MQQSIWKTKLKQNINDPDILTEKLGISSDALKASKKASKYFPLRVPPDFVSRMNNDDPEDPLLRQIFPIEEEEIPAPGFNTDPLSEKTIQTVPGLLQKYHGRALLVTTGACAIHCRYCFRRHFPYASSNPSTGNWERAIDQLNQDTSIKELILSGGDPLTLSDARLMELTAKLSDIRHIERLRVHTRMPIVLPERVTEKMLEWLTETRLKPILIVHVNHANELSDRVAKAIQKIQKVNIPILNQSVLLKGVNDSANILIDLSERLFDLGILPYYLHMLDPVAGAAHFDVDEVRAKAIMEQVRSRLPGYLVPKLVKEQVGASYKISI